MNKEDRIPKIVGCRIYRMALVPLKKLIISISPTFDPSRDGHFTREYDLLITGLLGFKFQVSNINDKIIDFRLANDSDFIGDCRKSSVDSTILSSVRQSEKLLHCQLILEKGTIDAVSRDVLFQEIV